jgi:hypothetical protein
LATVVIVRPPSTPAAATISTPWQTTGFEEVAGDPEQVGVVAEILRSAAARKEKAGVVLRHDVVERDSRPDVVRRLFPRDVPGDRLIGRDLVHNAVIVARFRPGDDDLETILGQAEERVERIKHFRPVADGHEYLRHEKTPRPRFAQWPCLILGGRGSVRA